MTRRKPNAWIGIPTIVLSVLGMGLGWIVTDVACSQDAGESCPGWSALFAIISGLVVAIGLLVVLSLVFRSLAEWKEASEEGEEPPGPGCEI